MTILTPQEVPTHKLRELDPDIVRVINNNLQDQVWEWLMDSDWLPEKDLIIKTLDAAGWRCTIKLKATMDSETTPYWIYLEPKKSQKPTE